MPNTAVFNLITTTIIFMVKVSIPVAIDCVGGAFTMNTIMKPKYTACVHDT